MTTQAEKDALLAADDEVRALIEALVVDVPAPPPPPPKNAYISRGGPTTALVTTGPTGLSWTLYGNRQADGTDIFVGNVVGASFSATYQVRGKYLVQQGNGVYAKQLDGTWLQGAKWSSTGVAVPGTVINDPLA
jgi:hypothetical protein